MLDFCGQFCQIPRNSGHKNKKRPQEANMYRIAVIIATFGFSGFAWAQTLGEVTNLPIPRFVSMKASEGYARRGPSQGHRIDWVFQHKNTPLRITGEYEHWRRVEDVDGQGGWMHFRLLSGVRVVSKSGIASTSSLV